MVGVLCAVLVGGGTGPVLGIVLVGLGGVLATSLVFFEVGLSEDRDRARQGRSRRSASMATGEQGNGEPEPPDKRSPGKDTRRLDPPRLERGRGHRRRLK